ncbi:MAG: FAD-dependent oxidoreductase [Nanoarchaeota archaeon]
MSLDVDVAIIGAGIVGNAFAEYLSRQLSGRNILVLDQGRIPGDNQSARNLGVVHVGVYYNQQESPLRAIFCGEGNVLLYELCREHDLPIRKTGKLIVAQNMQDETMVDMLLARGRENNVPGICKIAGEEIERYEPNVRGVSALWLPSSGIVEPTSVVKKLRSLAEQAGVQYFERAKVTHIDASADEFVVHVSRGGRGEDFTFSTKYLINAAGLYSDEVARMVNPAFPYHVFPVRGEAVKYYADQPWSKVSHNIYPAPVFFAKPDGTRQMTLGVHLTPTFAMDAQGNYIKESTGEYAFGRTVTVGPLSVTKLRGKPIDKNNCGRGLRNTKAFYRRIRKMFPGIRKEDLEHHQAGVQAVLAETKDFVFQRDELYHNMIHAVGICSPGITSALAMARHLPELVPEWQ